MPLCDEVWLLVLPGALAIAGTLLGVSVTQHGEAKRAAQAMRHERLEASLPALTAYMTHARGFCEVHRHYFVWVRNRPLEHAEAMARYGADITHRRIAMDDALAEMEVVLIALGAPSQADVLVDAHREFRAEIDDRVAAVREGVDSDAKRDAAAAGAVLCERGPGRAKSLIREAAATIHAG